MDSRWSVSIGDDAITLYPGLVIGLLLLLNENFARSAKSKRNIVV